MVNIETLTLDIGTDKIDRVFSLPYIFLKQKTPSLLAATLTFANSLDPD